MKKTVLIVGCKNYPAFSSDRVISGGMEVYVYEILEHLKRTFRFTVIAGYSHSDDADIHVINVPLIGKFVFQPISLFFYSIFIAIRMILTRKRVDLVNAQTPLTGLVGYILKRALRIPYIVTVHIFAATPDHVGGAAGLYGFIEKIVLRNADKVISAGNELKGYLDKRYGFEDDHVIVINPGMDVVYGKDVVVSQALLKKLEGDDFKMLFLGRLIEENGLWDLLEAMRMLREEKLKLYIAGNGNLEKKIIRFIEKEQLHEKVTLLGVVKGADKQHLIRNVDLAIRTSYHEVFPVAYLESVSVGVPVIATPVGDTEYIAAETGAITIVPMRDTERIAHAVKNCMVKGPLSHETVLKARAFITGISWENQALKTKELFINVITGYKNK
jgi:glycosyltransferase involved in cell wall biosynthesis